MNILDQLSTSELWFYGGIVIMIIAIILLLIFSIILILQKWKIKNQLEKEYGSKYKK